MNSGDHAPRVAILGARGIGIVHARIYRALGARIVSVLCRSMDSARKAAAALEEAGAGPVAAFSDLDRLLDETSPALVSICTPPSFHLEPLAALGDRGIPAFCEKPLFWSAGLTREQLERGLAGAVASAQGRLMVNTSNASFLDAVRGRLGDTGQGPRSFRFLFHTRGVARSRDIAIDLLPHAFSLLEALQPEGNIRGLTEEVSTNRYRCRFSYDDREVQFDLQEKEDGPRALEFEVDGRRFTRVQTGQGSTYRVFLDDAATGERLEVSDPFFVYLERFLQATSSGDRETMERAYRSACRIHRLACGVLLA